MSPRLGDRRAADWIAANWPSPDSDVGSRRIATRRHVWRDLLEQFQPFAAGAVFELREAGGVTTGPRQAFDESRADRIDDIDEYDGTERLECNGAVAALPVARMTSGKREINSAASLR